MNKKINTLSMLSGVTVYKNIKKVKLVKRFISLLSGIKAKSKDSNALIEDYSEICGMLYESEYQGSLPDFLLDKILCDENVFTVMCAKQKHDQLPENIKYAASFDLYVFYKLSQITSKKLKDTLVLLFPEEKLLIDSLPEYSNASVRFLEYCDWGNNAAQIADYHDKHGISVYAKYFAFYYENDEIIPIKKFVKVMLSDIKKYEVQKNKVVDNTLSFINKKPANNALLYGERGTGKSTTIKAILNEYHDQGLRMIQIAKEDISKINVILSAIKNVPLQFIIFIDDLTFNEYDEGFNTLKAVLEGSLNAMPKNVLIYATTNRRHIIKETFSSREGNELHASDTRDEMASLSDRFGLTVTFSKPNLQEYFDIVLLLARERGIELDDEVIKKGANIFAMQKASRSGRVASQYIDYLEGRISLGLPI